MATEGVWGKSSPKVSDMVKFDKDRDFSQSRKGTCYFKSAGHTRTWRVCLKKGEIACDCGFFGVHRFPCACLIFSAERGGISSFDYSTLKIPQGGGKQNTPTSRSLWCRALLLLTRSSRGATCYWPRLPCLLKRAVRLKSGMTAHTTK